MSLKTFFNGIIAEIGKLFERELPEAKEAIDVAYHVTNAIKTFDTKLPFVADILTALLPAGISAETKDILRVRLPQIVVELRLIDVTLGLTDPDQILLAAIKAIEEMEGSVKSIFLNSLSIMISQAAADGHLAWDIAVYSAKWYFDHKGFSNATAEAPAPVVETPLEVAAVAATIPVETV